MALESSGRVVITDAAKAAEQRYNIRADSRVFFTDFPTRRRVAGLRNPAYPTAKRQMTRPNRSAHCRQLFLAHNPSWMAFKYLHGGEGRAVFDIEVFGAGQACRMDADLSLPP